MTAASALANTDLGEFEGSPVLGTAIEIPNAGGGLRDALGIEPRVLHKGQRVMVLLECEMVKPSFPPVKDSQGVTRVHTLKAIGATIVDGDVFTEALSAQAEKIRLANEAAQGIHGLPFDDALDDPHEAGDHASGLVQGCPRCESEKAAAAAEDESNVKPIGGRKAAKAKDGE